MMPWLMCALFFSAAADGADSASPEEVPAATRKLLETFREEFIHITPGKGKFPESFRMGRADGSPAEKPVHTVTWRTDFYMARYEVPQNLYAAVMGSNPSKWQGPRNSAEMFSFQQAEEFCRRVTRLLRLCRLIGEDQEVRIPTEAEWEYCARAGTTGVYSFGDDADRLGDFGWFTGNAAGNDPPVGAKKPNPWGLYDVHGYLWEFCADHWHDSYEGAPADGSAWRDGGDPQRCVLRGGSWKDKAEACTSSHRLAAPKTLRDDAVGLRCVLARRGQTEN